MRIHKDIECQEREWPQDGAAGRSGFSTVTPQSLPLLRAQSCCPGVPCIKNCLQHFCMGSWGQKWFPIHVACCHPIFRSLLELSDKNATRLLHEQVHRVEGREFTLCSVKLAASMVLDHLLASEKKAPKLTSGKLCTDCH
eukprot:1149747-Pelagomonas_calceolata.AAC.4